MKQFKIALFIGRFQPFHNGHWYSLQKCFELADRVVVGIGSSQESGTENNPWNYENRRAMIVSLKQDVEVVPLPDLFDDTKWGAQVLDVIRGLGYKVGEVVGVGNNDWTNRILRARGIEVYESGLYKRNELEGVKIRELIIRESTEWKTRVPEQVREYLEKYATAN